MANRRMFSARITESTRFIKMPSSTQNLYFHLGMKADDDGVVEAYPVMCTIGATEDDLRILMSKGFVTVLNEDMVTYIDDWLEHNNIRADRKVDSIYKDLLVQVLPNVEIKEKKESYYLRKKMICQTNDKQMGDKTQTNDSIGKVRLGKEKKNMSLEPETDSKLSGIKIPLVDRTFYDVPEEKIVLWSNAYPAVNVEYELKKMIAWCDANPTKQKTRRGINSFINRWLAKQQDSGGSKVQKDDIRKENQVVHEGYDSEYLKREYLKKQAEMEGTGSGEDRDRGEPFL